MSARSRDAAEIHAVYPSRKVFLQSATVFPSEARLYWAAPGAAFTLNAPVRVILGFEGEAVRFTFRGEVMKVVEESLRGTHRTGAVIRITGEEQKAFGAALSFARGVDPSLGRRAHARWRTRIPAQLGDGAGQQAVLLDISEGGTCARLTSEPPPAGSLQPLVIDGAPGGVIAVRVAWLGRRDGEPACGLEFLDLPSEAREWLLRTLATVSKTH